MVDKAAREPSAPQRAMHKLGLVRDIDLALHLPARYEDETRLDRLAHARDGALVQVEGVVADSRVEFRPRRQLVVRLVDDEGEALVLRFLNFYGSQQKAYAAGRRLRVRGELRGGFLGREMVHPAVKPADSPLPTALTPVYPTSAQLPQAYLRKAIGAALVRVSLHEVLPAALLPPDLPTLRDAVLFLHQPPPGTALAAVDDRSHPAWQRLKFEELLAQQVSQLTAQHARAELRAPRLQARRGGLHERLLGALPFALTAAQRRVAGEIAVDLARGQPMHRLLQGDVGSGKTVVAALAALIAIDAGWQCALMAPTEILAEQHLHSFARLGGALGLRTALLTGSTPAGDRRRLERWLEDGALHVVVGTHALLSESVELPRLALAVIDEQHRFGVEQRRALARKAGTPHLLAMSATPIPRSLALTVFGDLEHSVLRERPPGRAPVSTQLVGPSAGRAVMDALHETLRRGEQVFVVYPLVDESEKQDLKDATRGFERMGKALPGVPAALIHGRMDARERQRAMADFAEGRVRILVATTVIEVGVDVPNATLLIVQHAERFGLAQLHQLRGRVGRGEKPGQAILIADPTTPEGAQRLAILERSHSGFEIAEEDLRIRGAGEWLGTRQAGHLPELRMADLVRHGDTLEAARRAAASLLEGDPELRRMPALRAAVERRWGARLALGSIG